MFKPFILILLLSVINVGAQSAAFNSAQIDYQKGNYVKAINLFAEDPSPESQLQIARAYQALGNYDKAEKQYLAVIELDSTLFIAQNELGMLYFKISEFKKARLTYYKLVTAENTNPFYYYQLGRIENIDKQPFKAISYFKSSYQLDSTNIKNIYEIGKHHLQQRQLDSVHKYADIGLEMAPNSIDLNNLKALAYFNNGEKEPAIPYFEKLLDLNQHKTYIYKSLAECYEFKWEYEKAFDCYKTVIQLDNGDPEGYRGLGHLYAREKKWDSAKINYKTAIEVQKVNFNTEYMALANITIEEKNIKTAINYYQQAYDQDPKNYYALFNVCRESDNYYKDKNYVLNLYKNYVDVFPDNLYTKLAKNRISELKKEIHLAANN
ncbi:tetratricopeptide repeat protein [Galbibacter mesophilus]|uniref:tetratricopeptide repeat protein n=1 Tax=Galbibacter mesophilus TaxID=379069 RepID=UPI00191EBA19|nr:tetratricopeptide repeat protein [Galbibacter mesophilus]MCM5662260.1 tetratricopeptide repeat protein [Galbibacter mesophilus]